MLTPLGTMALLAASAPASKCDIAMENWCIAQLPSSVSMKEVSGRREWIVYINNDVSRSTVRIVEDKFCDGYLTYRLATDGKLNYQALSINECGLHISVLSKERNVPSSALIERLVFVRKGSSWLPLRLPAS